MGTGMKNERLKNIVLRQETTLEKLEKSKVITESCFVIGFRDKLYPVLMFLAKTKVQYKIHVINDSAPLQGTPIMLRAAKRRSCIFGGRQNLAVVDWLFFVLNGTLWGDRKSGPDMAASKKRWLPI